MKKKFDPAKQKAKQMTKAIENLSPEEVAYGMLYPTSELIECALDRMSDSKKKELEKKFEENNVLLTKYEGLKAIISEHNISSEEEYRNFLKNQFNL